MVRTQKPEKLEQKGTLQHDQIPLAHERKSPIIG
jgi:hypothetical protein